MLYMEDALANLKDTDISPGKLKILKMWSSFLAISYIFLFCLLLVIGNFFFCQKQ